MSWQMLLSKLESSHKGVMNYVSYRSDRHFMQLPKWSIRILLVIEENKLLPPWHCRWRYSGYRVEDLELPEDICRPCTVHPRKCSPESRWRYIKGGRRPSSSWMLLKPSTLLCFRSPSEVPDTWETPSLAVQLLFLQDQTWLQNKSWRRVVWR